MLLPFQPLARCNETVDMTSVASAAARMSKVSQSSVECCQNPPKQRAGGGERRRVSVSLVALEAQDMFKRSFGPSSIPLPDMQGINDRLIPFFIVFQEESVTAENDLEKCHLGDLQRVIIEAEAFWCESKFLNCI